MGDRVFYINSPSDNSIVEFDVDSLSASSIAFSNAGYFFKLFLPPWCISEDGRRLYFIEANTLVGGKVRVGYFDHCTMDLSLQRVDLFEVDNTGYDIVPFGWKNSDDDRFYLWDGFDLRTYDELGNLLQTNTTFSAFNLDNAYLGQSELTVHGYREGTRPTVRGVSGDLTAPAGGVGLTWTATAPSVGASAGVSAGVRFNDWHSWFTSGEDDGSGGWQFRLWEVHEGTYVSDGLIAVPSGIFSSSNFAMGISQDGLRMYGSYIKTGPVTVEFVVATGGFDTYTSLLTGGSQPLWLIVGNEHFDDCTPSGGEDEIYNVTLIGAN